MRRCPPGLVDAGPGKSTGDLAYDGVDVQWWLRYGFREHAQVSVRRPAAGMRRRAETGNLVSGDLVGTGGRGSMGSVSILVRETKDGSAQCRATGHGGRQRPVLTVSCPCHVSVRRRYLNCGEPVGVALPFIESE